VPVVPMTPRAAEKLDGGVRSVPESPSAPDEACGPAPSPRQHPMSARSARSASGRRGTSPREYVVEAISPARARELAPDVPLDPCPEQCSNCDSPRSQQAPTSPALLLGPCEESCEESNPDIHQSDTVSISSDEGAIRDRLKQSLQLRGVSTETTAAVDSPRMSEPASRHAAGSSSPGRATASARTAYSPMTPRGHGAASVMAIWARQQASRFQQAPARVGSFRAVNTSGTSSASSTRRGAPPPPPNVAPVQTPQRQYAPVLSRRSLGADWRPHRGTR